MDDRSLSGSQLAPPALDPRAAHEWRQLSADALIARRKPNSASINPGLFGAAKREPQSPAAPAYHLWAADNFAADGDYAAALRAYDEVIKQADGTAPLFDPLDFTSAALRNKAGTASLLGDVTAAAEAWRALLAHSPDDAEAGLLAGLAAETLSKPDEAVALYEAVAAKKPSLHADDDGELASRALLRMKSPRAAFQKTARQVADQLAAALSEGDTKTLRQLASPTHFTIGMAGGHQFFQPEGFPEQILRDLVESDIACGSSLDGIADDRYLVSRGWNGRWLQGDVYLTISQSPRGWQWSGVAMTRLSIVWMDQWPQPVATARSASRTFGHDLLAPWPAGLCFRAGGWKDLLYTAQITFIATLPWWGQRLFAQFSSGGGCGWGIPGFYYDSWPTHDYKDEFAIDFLRYNSDVPFDNVSGGTPVLASLDGVAGEVKATAPTGSSRLNRTHVYHADPDNPGDRTRYMTRYLHLDGPYVDNVSTGMNLFTGNRLGRMDSTGRPPNFMKHLHFSIHDREIDDEQDYGGSIRPSPMSGVTLEDGDNARCVCSDNVELIGARPMIYPSSYPVVNWLITPVAPIANRQTPTIVQQQKFLLILSGVAIVEFKGTSANAWHTGTVLINPDLVEPIKYACTEHAIPRPPEADDPSLYTSTIDVEQIVQVNGLASIFNDNESHDSGFAVNAWRPQPYKYNELYRKLFNGIAVDIGARDTDAYVKRLSYHVTILGRIIFHPTPPIA